MRLRPSSRRSPNAHRRLRLRSRRVAVVVCPAGGVGGAGSQAHVQRGLRRACDAGSVVPDASDSCRSGHSSLQQPLRAASSPFCAARTSFAPSLDIAAEERARRARGTSQRANSQRTPRGASPRRRRRARRARADRHVRREPRHTPRHLHHRRQFRPRRRRPRPAVRLCQGRHPRVRVGAAPLRVHLDPHVLVAARGRRPRERRPERALAAPGPSHGAARRRRPVGAAAGVGLHPLEHRPRRAAARKIGGEDRRVPRGVPPVAHRLLAGRHELAGAEAAAVPEQRLPAGRVPRAAAAAARAVAAVLLVV